MALECKIGFLPPRCFCRGVVVVGGGGVGVGVGVLYQAFQHGIRVEDIIISYRLSNFRGLTITVFMNCN